MPAAHCISCGLVLQAEHRFCPRCGAPRWYYPPAPYTAAQTAPPTSPPGPPGPGVQAAAAPVLPIRPSRLLPWFYAGAAVLWLISATQATALVISRAGRAQLAQQIDAGGLGPATQGGVLALGLAQVLFFVAAACLHAIAFYGLRARRRWGWLTAVLLAGLWSLVLVGIPLLVVLLRPSTRRFYGID